MTKTDVKTLLIASGKRAIVGNISPAVRAIAIGIKDDQILQIKCYLDAIPNVSDYERLSDISAEILGDIDLNATEEICEYDIRPIAELDQLFGFIYVK
ncbi:hypothetical protein [Mucilaginibacter sp. SJ]|uniref:hypothetical protein n=1 Tax=Mucilaginibacter sp. SJ TaxID=3029053 RepID=UPI0023A9A822|nr:hypothetical protein [Mucilaginibacter sp. SJ]WEA00537.1 hypothetical protein MusilaSJ_24065 [Mucilaginibacter sp. SJ]